MPENSIHSMLIQSFSKSDKEIWKRAASSEIDGKDPFEELKWRNQDELVFFPYYESEDVAKFNFFKKFRFTVAQDLFHGPRKWLCVPSVSVQDEVVANKFSLEHLSGGADGIYFILSSDVDLDKLLNNVEWAYCSLFFRVADAEVRRKFFSSLLKKKYNPNDSLAGALFWDDCPKKGDADIYLQVNKNFKSVGLIIKPSSPAKEVAEALTLGVKAIENLKNDKNLSDVFHAIAFSLSMETNFLESIAKLKALRLLWYQVSQAYGITEFNPSDLHIHTQSLPWISKNFEPHGNMLSNTTTAMASVLGGSDSLTIHPQDENNRTMTRIARNISAVLREESHLNKVADPVLGSYTIDTIVNTIAKCAWTIFQSNNHTS